MAELFNIDRLKSIIIDVLKSVTGVRLIYLFGSRVDGNVGPLSDYDLGVLIDRLKDEPQIRSLISYTLAKKLQTKNIDVVLLNRVPIELAFSIIAYGELLYECNVQTKVEYEARIMSMYFDYLPVLRAQRKDILQGGEYAARVQRYRKTFRRTERALSQIRALENG
ncbi:nucleotidyltransferase domain-containing protein [Thermodesulfobacteriota bacterium]